MTDYQPALDGDDSSAEFVSLLTAAHGKLLGYLTVLLGRHHDAQDVLQRASVLMWKKYEDFEQGSDFVAWASTFCFYEAKNFQRMIARSPLLFDDELMKTLSAERLNDLSNRDLRISALDGCIQKLRTEDQGLIRAAYQQGEQITELAAQFGRAPQTLYNKLNIFRRQLANCVEQRLAIQTASS